MKLYLITSNDYAGLVPENLARLERYWPDIVPIVLHYDVEPKMAEAVSHYKLGEQAEYGRSWTDALKCYFGDICREKYFVVWLDDYHLAAPVNLRKAKILENFVREGADKADLTDDRAKFPYTIFAGNEELLVSAQDARYRSSLQAAIWRRDYFLGYLKPSRTIWQFETMGYREHIGDGATILGYRKDPPVVYDNVRLKGKANNDGS